MHVAYAINTRKYRKPSHRVTSDEVELGLAVEANNCTDVVSQRDELTPYSSYDLALLLAV
jgi:hypothetical protein